MKDTLFLDDQSVISPFCFNNEVVTVFDDMVSRSVPCYWDIIKLIVVIIAQSISDKGHVYDLGCSTGNVIKAILNHIDCHGIEIDGVDLSADMLMKAESKLSVDERQCVNLTQFDLNKSIVLQPTNAVILNLTLQFLVEDARQRLLQTCYHALDNKGVMIIVEKVAGCSAEEADLFSWRFDYFKQLNGYSVIEIENKKKAIKSILQPFTIVQNEVMFHNAGFTYVNQQFRWGNFVGWELRK